ncbi:MAG TPA: hypothetical protein VMW24_00375 [Sedimentisphaerales bacterium]|nr:hypothetical protein [Sedimentisphaerales bacterium]
MGILDDYEFGMECFDNLTFGQRIGVSMGILRAKVRGPHNCII